MRPPQTIEDAARARIARADDQIRNSLEKVRQGNPLAAEWEPDRLVRRIQTKARLSRGAATAVAAGIKALEAVDERARAEVMTATAAAAERIYGGTIDFVGVSFLERGAAAARAVARVAFRDGRAQGSGFLISDRLFLTNNHVVSAASQSAHFALEFDYELDATGRRRDVSRFFLDPDVFFVTNDENDLDFTVVAVGQRESGPRELTEYGWCPLSDASDKHALGEIANIVQHPDGRYKEVVLRENRLVSRLDTVLHYVADTEPGSSGSPVFNNEWQAVALHHWGGPWRQRVDDAGRPVSTEVNEGIRASAIVGALRALAPNLAPAKRALLEGAIRIGEGLPGPASGSTPARPSRASVLDTESGGARLEADGRVTWRIPIELSVRLPGLAPPEPPARPAPLSVETPVPERRVELDRNYDNRPGYRPNFITGFPIRLPRLSRAQERLAAKNVDAEAGDDPFELKYQHFSVVVNKKRRLAFFTACNIDGRASKDIDRKTGAIKPRKPGGEAMAEGAEASETWYDDPRVEADATTPKELYAGQEVPGVPDKQSAAFRNRMFQRGHLVRRTDPAWGTDERAFRADADTFHLTNCSPQVGFFNTGSAPRSVPRSGGGKFWRALEDYVLDNAVEEHKRVSVFTGPVLNDRTDPLWREQIVPGFRVPLRFWKIVAWAARGRLHATAMIADQEPVISVMPEALAGGERFVDTSAVADFLTSVGEIERLTGLDFGDELRAADITPASFERESFGRIAIRRVNSFDDIPFPGDGR